VDRVIDGVGNDTVAISADGHTAGTVKLTETPLGQGRPTGREHLKKQAYNSRVLITDIGYLYQKSVPDIP